jgi:hypothetical protein
MRLAEQHGPVLGGRDLAESIKADLVRRADAGETVVVDFEGVVAVTPSFADEFFAKLPDLVSRHVEFVNVSDHLQAVAQMARAGRPENGSGSSH